MTDQRISSEDRQKFTELYESLRRFAAVLGAPGLDPDDLVQESLVRTLRRSRLTEIDHPAAYLRRTMMNLASKARTRAAIERRAVARHGIVGALGRPDSYPSDLAELLQLPREARAVLYLAEVEGYRFEEIAEMLGCSAAAARKRASRARGQLRDALAAEASS